MITRIKLEKSVNASKRSELEGEVFEGLDVGASDSIGLLGTGDTDWEFNIGWLRLKWGSSFSGVIELLKFDNDNKVKIMNTQLDDLYLFKFNTWCIFSLP